MNQSSEKTFSPNDLHFMDVALRLAARGLGRVSPNPAVGCVIVRDGRIVGRGWTQDGGRPHAETEALQRAGALARGAVAYVSLEPCSHHGKTPPCADALIEAGIGEVVVAASDPDPRVSGKGISALEEAGIRVRVGALADRARSLNEGFIKKVTEGRPLVRLKLATSLDGKIATHSGQSHWITGAEARDRSHLLRAETDAILVGSTTAILDNPELTCRLPGLRSVSPIRVVVDGRLRLPLTAKLVSTAKSVPVWLFTRSDTDEQRRAAFADCGVDVIELEPGADGRLPVGDVLKSLAARGVTRLLVEGGSGVAASFVREGAVDRISWFVAPKIVGGDGISGIGGLGLDSLGDAPIFSRSALASVGDDLLASYEKPA